MQRVAKIDSDQTEHVNQKNVKNYVKLMNSFYR